VGVRGAIGGRRGRKGVLFEGSEVASAGGLDRRGVGRRWEDVVVVV
jgi:hypothetical protein